MDLSYEEFMRRTREQESRDRDRFMGFDSHAEQPLYEASTGAPVNSAAVNIDVAATIQAFASAVTRAWEGFAAAVVPAIEQAVLDLAQALNELHIESEAPKAAKARHSYPRPHREWWNRR